MAGSKTMMRVHSMCQVNEGMERPAEPPLDVRWVTLMSVDSAIAEWCGVSE